MAPSPRLELRQTQTLVMTPQLRQAIKLLQLSNLEVASYIEDELEQNPLLEREEASGASGALDVEADAAVGGADASDGGAPAVDMVANLDADYDNLWSSDGVGEGSGAGPREAWRATGGSDDVTAMVEQTPAAGIGLRDHLLNQLNIDVLDPIDRMIGVHLIDMLDEAGYLSDDPELVARKLGCDIGRVVSTLEKLQDFDPPGVFARTLRECLALQLRERGRLNAAMETLLDNLDLIAEHQTEELQLRCGTTANELEAMLGEFTSLNPKPGLAFDSEVAQAIVPDVMVHRRDGGWIVELNNDTLPKVLVNQRYYATIRRQAKTKSEKAYLVDRLASANWLVKSLDQRANTILRVATELVSHQEAFFRHGVQHLKPLILRDIAEVIGMHESTVSRVTANKYLSTPRGTFEMRYFFTNAIPSIGADGPVHSSEAVRDRIKSMIEDEDADDVLSDDRIVAMLRMDGIDIARRTVAKYREAMRIPSSLKRRRMGKRLR